MPKPFLEFPIIAAGRLFVLDFELQVSCKVNLPKEVHSPAEFVISSDHPDAPKVLTIAFENGGSARFEGNAIDGTGIIMMYLLAENITGAELKGNASFFSYGNLHSAVSKEDKFEIMAQITLSPILPSETLTYSHEGTVERLSGTEPRTIEWMNPSGEVVLENSYSYEREPAFARTKVLQTRNNILRVLHQPEEETDFKSMLLELQNWLADDLLLISFLGRKRVALNHATVNLADGSRKSVFPEAECRYRVWSGFFKNSDVDTISRCVIGPKKLRDGIFANLIENLRVSTYRDLIETSIQSLLTTYEDGYLEAHLISSFGALEVLVNGIGEQQKINYSLSNSEFKKLRTKLKDTLTDFIDDPTTLEAIVAKFPELRRRPFSDRLFDLIEIFEIPFDTIWPKYIDLRHETHQLLKRRNELVHLGKLSVPEAAIFDLRRVQKLVELWILKLLDCPDDAISPLSPRGDAPLTEVVYI